MWVLHKLLSSMNVVDSVEFMLDKLNGTKNNKEFFDMMSE
jgi:transcription termination factor Rho